MHALNHFRGLRRVLAEEGRTTNTTDLAEGRTRAGNHGGCPFGIPLDKSSPSRCHLDIKYLGVACVSARPWIYLRKYSTTYITYFLQSLELADFGNLAATSRQPRGNLPATSRQPRSPRRSERVDGRCRRMMASSTGHDPAIDWRPAIGRRSAVGSSNRSE